MIRRGFLPNLRLYIVALAVVGSFGVVAYRLVELHVLDREHFLAQIQDTRHRVVAESARRGDIYDARGDLLATTKTDITLAVDRWALVERIEAQRFPERKQRYEEEQRSRRVELAGMLGMPPDEVEALFTPSWKDVPVEDDVHDE